MTVWDEVSSALNVDVGAGIGLDLCYFINLVPEIDISADEIRVFCWEQDVGAINIKWAIYNDDLTSLIYGNNTGQDISVGEYSEDFYIQSGTFSPVSLTNGTSYWIAIKADDSPTILTIGGYQEGYPGLDEARSRVAAYQAGWLYADNWGTGGWPTYTELTGGASTYIYLYVGVGDSSQVLVSDTGTGTDEAPTITASVSVSDTATGSDALTIGSPGAAVTTHSFHQSRQLSVITQDPLYLSTRTYSRRITPLISRYSHEIRSIGGYYSANITLTDSIRRLEEWASRGIGRHIAVYNPSLVQIWEGFINQITITEGGEQFNLGPLIDVGNRVTAAYSPVNATVAPPVSGGRTMTAVGNNTNSQELYGIWEKIVGVNQVTATEAAQLRDIYLNDPTRVYPNTSLDSSLMGGGGLQVELQCLGYWHFLAGYYYANAAATGYVSITTKIQSTLAAAPNAGVFSTDYSQIATNATLVKAYEGGDRTAETILKDINGLGDSSFNSYTIGFYNNRQLVYQPVPTAIEYQRRATGNRGIVNRVNREIMPWNVLPARWIFRPDFLVGRFPPITAASLGSDPRAAFIEVVQFDAPYSLSINGRKLSQLDQVLSRRGLGGAA